jgi:hypothetical protein
MRMVMSMGAMLLAVWTKADSVTSFDALIATPLG